MRIASQKLPHSRIAALQLIVYIIQLCRRILYFLLQLSVSVVSFKEDHFISNFCLIFQPVESKLLSNYFMCKSHTLWMQNIQEKYSLTEQVIIYSVQTGHGKPGKSQNFKNFIFKAWKVTADVKARKISLEFLCWLVRSKHMLKQG